MNRKNNRKIITHMIPEYIKNMQNHLEKMYPACFFYVTITAARDQPLYSW